MRDQMIILDGSTGEGGGQILRTALSLSMTSGRPFRIDNIRAGRAKPGLLRQHLTAVNAAATISNATIDGATIGSRSLTFSPNKAKGGDYTFAIGSAGSTTLVFETILPALMLTDEPSTVALEGGTHNIHAPPFDFLERAYLPLVNRLGPHVELKLERAGFYPAGGGRFSARVQPSVTLTPFHLRERGEIRKKVAKAAVAGLSGEIAKRELAVVEKMLGWTGEQLQIRQLEASWGPGNILTLDIESEYVTDVFTSFGVRGISAESVGESVAREAREYLADGAPVGVHLTDQLLVPLALAGGGSFRTQALSLHSTTNIGVIEKFLPVKIDTAKVDATSVLVEINKTR